DMEALYKSERIFSGYSENTPKDNLHLMGDIYGVASGVALSEGNFTSGLDNDVADFKAWLGNYEVVCNQREGQWPLLLPRSLMKAVHDQIFKELDFCFSKNQVSLTPNFDIFYQKELQGYVLRLNFGEQASGIYFDLCFFPNPLIATLTGSEDKEGNIAQDDLIASAVFSLYGEYWNVGANAADCLMLNNGSTLCLGTNLPEKGGLYKSLENFVPAPIFSEKLRGDLLNVKREFEGTSQYKNYEHQYYLLSALLKLTYDASHLSTIKDILDQCNFPEPNESLFGLLSKNPTFLINAEKIFNIFDAFPTLTLEKLNQFHDELLGIKKTTPPTPKVETLFSKIMCLSVPQNFYCFENFDFATNKGKEVLPANKEIIPLGSLEGINSFDAFNHLFPGLSLSDYNFHTSRSDSLFYRGIVYADPLSFTKSKDDAFYVIHRLTGIALYLGTRSILENNGLTKDDLGQIVPVNPLHYYNDADVLREIGREFEKQNGAAEVTSLLSRSLCKTLPTHLSCYKNFTFAKNLGISTSINNLKPFGSIKNIKSLSEFDKYFPGLRKSQYNFSSSTENLFYWAIAYKDPVSFQISKDDVFYKVHKETGYALCVGPRTVLENCSRTKDDFNKEVPALTSNYYHDVKLLIEIGKRLEESAWLEKLELYFSKIECKSTDHMVCYSHYNLDTHEGTPSRPNNGALLPFGRLKEIPTIAKFDLLFGMVQKQPNLGNTRRA
ncbi:MAG: hypothetical protein H0U49_07280, partial [Parachlamydiaceae bacterium]|nr:hypothetical protein [Parachlamydiaceae bacterium]